MPVRLSAPEPPSAAVPLSAFHHSVLSLVAVSAVGTCSGAQASLLPRPSAAGGCTHTSHEHLQGSAWAGLMLMQHPSWLADQAAGWQSRGVAACTWGIGQGLGPWDALSRPAPPARAGPLCAGSAGPDSWKGNLASASLVSSLAPSLRWWACCCGCGWVAACPRYTWLKGLPGGRAAALLIGPARGLGRSCRASTRSGSLSDSQPARSTVCRPAAAAGRQAQPGARPLRCDQGAHSTPQQPYQVAS